MARRASSKTNFISVLVVLVLLALVGGGTYYLANRISDPYRTLERLDVSQYYENANSLRGNLYKVDAEVLNLLQWTPTNGRLFSVDVDSDDGSGPLGVLVPPEFKATNIQRGQSFLLKIEVGEAGILIVRDISKK